MPGSRDEALDGMRSRLAESDKTSERIFQLRLELDDAFGSCADKVKTLDDMNELDEALTLATVCGLSESRTDLLDRTGRYTEELVSGRQDWLDHRAFAAIAIGNWQVAAETAVALAAQQRDEAWKVTLNCAAE